MFVRDRMTKKPVYNTIQYYYCGRSGAFQGKRF